MNMKTNRKGSYKLIWLRYKRNKLAMLGMIVFIVMLAAVFSAPLYIDYAEATTQHIVVPLSRLAESIFSARISSAVICSPALSTAAGFLLAPVLPRSRFHLSAASC